MTERKQSQTSRSAEEKMRRDRVPKSDEVIGRDVPDESKERHTEIAVEAGRKVGEHHDGDKH
jgi:hypothetical protein